MPEKIVYLNHSWVPESAAVVSIWDRGFTLGDAFYEAMRTFNHKPFKVREHVHRLYRSLKIARIDPGIAPDQFIRVIDELVERNRAFYEPGEDFFIYPYVSRGVGGHPLRCGSPTIAIATKAIGWAEYAKFYDSGVHLVTPSIRRQPPQCWDAKIKTTSRFSHTLADIEVAQVHPDAYCLLLDLNGNVAEHRSSNFCIVRDGVVEAPTATNVLRGITVGTVFDLAAKLGIETRERDIQTYDVYNADEAFLASTSFCVLPATKLNGAAIGTGRPGPVVKRLLDTFSSLVGLDIPAQATRLSNR